MVTALEYSLILSEYIWISWPCWFQITFNCTNAEVMVESHLDSWYYLLVEVFSLRRSLCPMIITATWWNMNHFQKLSKCSLVLDQIDIVCIQLGLNPLSWQSFSPWWAAITTNIVDSHTCQFMAEAMGSVAVFHTCMDNHLNQTLQCTKLQKCLI